MNNIRKIITERLENARLDFGKTTKEPQLELKGQIEAYQDCLNLIEQNFNNSQLGIMNSQELTFYANKPTPKTEQDILNDFEKLEKENQALRNGIALDLNAKLLSENEKLKKAIEILKLKIYVEKVGFEDMYYICLKDYEDAIEKEQAELLKEVLGE